MSLIRQTESNLPTPSTPAETFKVVIAAAGADARAFDVPKGTSVGDLCRKANINLDRQILTIGREKVGPERHFNKGEILFVVPVPKNS